MGEDRFALGVDVAQEGLEPDEMEPCSGWTRDRRTSYNNKTDRQSPKDIEASTRLSTTRNPD
jgi:hypothetical protein